MRDLKQYDRRPLTARATTSNLRTCRPRWAAPSCAGWTRSSGAGARSPRATAASRPALGGETDPDGHIYFRYVLDAGTDAEAVIRRAARAGIACERPVHTPLHRLMGLTASRRPRMRGADRCPSPSTLR